MSPLSPARRDAEAFAVAVEDRASVVDGARGAGSDRYADLLTCVDVLRDQEIPVPRTDFVADLRMRLLDAADTLLVPPAASLAPVLPLHAPVNRSQRRISIAAAAFVVIGGTAGVAAAAESALPGDALYPIKRGIESAQVSLNASDSGKGQDLLRIAGTRLNEVDGLLSNNDSASAINRTLSSFRDSASSGADLLFLDFQRNGDSADITRLRAMLGSQLAKLDSLSAGAPDGTQPAFDDARALLKDLDQQASVLCGDCGTNGVSDPLALSAAPLSSLFTIPVTSQADRAAAAAARNAALAHRAGQIAKHTKHTLEPTGGSSGGKTIPDPGTDPTGGLPVPTPDTGGLGGIVGGLTSGVGALLGDSPLTDTLNTTLGSLGKLLP